MHLKVVPCWLLFFILSIPALGQQVKPRSQIDASLTREIDAVIGMADALHPGMTRADVLENFQIEGGISARQWNHYVYKRCPYIKLDVTFAVSPGENPFKESPTDKIASISRPYLQFSITD